MSDLRDYVRALSTVGSVKALYLLERGEDFEWSPRPPDVERGEAKQCYANAGQTALFNEGGYTYCEGYVNTGMMPIEHAWLVDEEGRVVDPTLRGPDDHECGFCADGMRLVCDTGDVEWAPQGEYGSVDPSCEECCGSGCHEVECFWCGGSGVDPEGARDLTGTTYFGVRIEANELRRLVVETGMWGALDKAEFYEALDDSMA